MELRPAPSFHQEIESVDVQRCAAAGTASPNKYPLVPRPAVIVIAAAAIRWRASPPRPTSRDRRGRKSFRPLAGGALEGALFEAALAGRDAPQRHPVPAHRTHRPIADQVTHNRTPRDYRQGRTCWALFMWHSEAFSSGCDPLDGRGGNRLICQAAMKCVACAAPP